MSQDIIKLDQFLKWSGVAETGGQAKFLVQNEKVLVNGTLETRRGRKLQLGDNVKVLASEAGPEQELVVESLSRE